MKRALPCLALLLAASAHAQAPAPDAGPAEPDAGTPAGPAAQPTPATPADVADLAARVRALEERLAAKERAPRPKAAPALLVMDGIQVRLAGYTDLGFFKAAGDGVAYVRDEGHLRHPELASYPWVFLGDPWANPINSQGESADLGLDRTNIARFDPVQSHGKASFIINLVNLGVQASAGDWLFSEVSLNFEPRQGTLGSPGDFLDVDLAYLEWRPLPGQDLHLFAGKFEPVVGLEYRTRKAPDRFGITPSLIARYTTGNPTGLKVRGSMLNGLLIYAASVTNGGPSTELFAHFFNEVDRNNFKTASARLALHRELGPASVELGGSGAYGAQDLQPDEGRRAWQAGADLKVTWGDLALRAEFVRVIQPGGGLAEAPSLAATGAYGELTYQALPWLGALARLDFRKAQLFAPPNLYLTDDLRYTAGLRFDLTFNLIAKVEYLHIQELDGPEIDDDVLTSSLIFRF